MPTLAVGKGAQESVRVPTYETHKALPTVAGLLTRVPFWASGTAHTKPCRWAGGDHAIDGSHQPDNGGEPTLKFADQLGQRRLREVTAPRADAAWLHRSPKRWSRSSPSPQEAGKEGRQFLRLPAGRTFPHVLVRADDHMHPLSRLSAHVEDVADAPCDRRRRPSRGPAGPSLPVFRLQQRKACARRQACRRSAGTRTGSITASTSSPLRVCLTTGTGVGLQPGRKPVDR